MGLLRWLLKELFYTPERVGKIGEDKIAKDLGVLDLFGYRGCCLQNLYIPMSDGNTSEIDVLYLTQKGLFVIESKNYSGFIFGSENQQQWTSTLYAGKTWYGKKQVNKYKFYNPIWQNNSHIKALQEYLGYVHAYSYIVFGDNCELKDVSYNASNVCVCNKSNLKRSIKRMWNQMDVVYDFNVLEELYARLLPLTNVSDEMKQRHIYKINEAATSTICPKCGGQLVLRTAKQGAYKGNSFYGCSNYPRCKYIRNL